MIKSDEVTISFRAPKQLRDAFDERLQLEDDTKSRVLRAAIRIYLSTHTTA
jgi:metal-responsive CopG/Arc/MetJ family transcriptional regulator